MKLTPPAAATRVAGAAHGPKPCCRHPAGGTDLQKTANSERQSRAGGAPARAERSDAPNPARAARSSGRRARTPSKPFLISGNEVFGATPKTTRQRRVLPKTVLPASCRQNHLSENSEPNAWRQDYVYDGKLRRRLKRDYTWSNGWLQTNEVRYVYDGNLVIQERNFANVAMVTYTRGNDLSGTLQGAGGIGGLLARTDTSNPQYFSKMISVDGSVNGQSLAYPDTAYYHADGNGNVTALLGTDQTLAAKYVYDPFGNLIGLAGRLAEANSYRFSSKEWNGPAGLYYYLYRFYDPNLQRWLNRDPLGELGFQSLVRAAETQPFGPTMVVSAEDWTDLVSFGINSDSINLYRFVANDPNSIIDPFGLGRVNILKFFHCLTCISNLRSAYKQAAQECEAKKKCYSDYMTGGNEADFDPDEADQLRRAYSDCYNAALRKAASKDCLECVTGGPITKPTL